MDEENRKSKNFFLATEYLDLGGAGRSSGDETNSTTLAYRLGKLHTTPAPPDLKTGKPRFGFLFPRSAVIPNSRTSSMIAGLTSMLMSDCSPFSPRLRTAMVATRGFGELVEKTAYKVVPRLLGDGHLGYDSHGEGEGIVPVVVHGDLWSGNADRGRIVGSGRDDQPGDVVYDPCVCYGHNEFDLGIMHMFGGFGARFFDQYHRVVPKTAPVEEYDDRVRLYELYHHLNHHAIFGGGYRSGAMSIMQKLVRKYGKDE
ncbi:hypothetical protein N7504_001132 [Penicillium tannophilum]|nr:hypothetical protein N7504_001132 [Penicillium tannophilum]